MFKSLFPWKRKVFIDCGGHNGSSVRKFRREIDKKGRFDIGLAIDGDADRIGALLPPVTEQLGEVVPLDKMVTIHNGIDTDRFGSPHDSSAIRAALGLCADQPVIGIVARLDPIKNHEALITAMKQIVAQLPRAVLLIVGDGPLRSELEAQVSSLALGDHVCFLGARADVPELLGAIDLFVLCSHSEGLSLTLIEACAAGKPIVATDVGGNAEVVQHQETGLLVPLGQPELLAEAILEVLGDREKALQMGQNGRRNFEEQFVLGAMVQEYEKLYELCLK